MTVYEAKQYVYILVLVFIYIHNLCMRAAMALTSLHFCADSPNPSLLVPNSHNYACSFRKKKGTFYIVSEQSVHTCNCLLYNNYNNDFNRSNLPHIIPEHGQEEKLFFQLLTVMVNAKVTCTKSTIAFIFRLVCTICTCTFTHLLTRRTMKLHVC